MNRSELKQLIREVIAEASTKTLEWRDGVKLELNSMGEPASAKYLGSLNSGMKLPDTDDWRRFFVSQTGNDEKFYSPKLNVWYDVNSSG